MEKLFSDSEVMLNKRPTEITEQQEKDYLQKVAEEIVANGWSDNDIEDIVYDLQDISNEYSGYEIAKKLEGYRSKSSYKINTEFIEFLDFFETEKDDILKENVKEWVKAFNPKPIFKEGDCIIINNKLNFHLKEGSIMFVTGINEEEANYYIHEEKDRNGGYVLTYEKVESNCKIYNNENKN